MLYYVQSYSPNVLREMLKGSHFILKVLEKRPANVTKTSRKNVPRVISMGHPENANYEPLLQMQFHCIIFNSITQNVCLKH